VVEEGAQAGCILASGDARDAISCSLSCLNPRSTIVEQILATVVGVT
jgi:hypothetical protein